MFSEAFFASIHPMVVHFPIALLTVYALLELIPFKKVVSDPRWILAKRVLLFVGTFGIFVALSSGEERGGENLEPGTVLAYHSLFATITTWIFGLLAGSQFVMTVTVWVTRFVTKREWLYVIWKIIERIARIISLRPILIIASITGLITLTITGALGGGMVFGPEADPMVSFIFNVLKLK
ncbi:MAG TPA: hypothetical protein PK295_03195 [Candidatus Magasanikbacteria bacterium]|nr:hypothetical protein [Candidatus Magasanikbacteria bacterium]